MFRPAAMYVPAYWAIICKLNKFEFHKNGHKSLTFLCICDLFMLFHNIFIVFTKANEL